MKKLFLMYCISVSLHTQGAAQFMRSFFTKPSYKQPVSLAYLYGLCTQERKLENGVVQQLNCGFDIHMVSPANKEQVQVYMNHLKQQPRESTSVFTEDIWGEPHWSCDKGCDGRFLHKTHDACIRENIKHENLEKRWIFLPGSPKEALLPNTKTMGDVLTHFEQWAESFKQPAIDAGILTEKDFEPLYALKKHIEPHKDKTVYDFWKENGYDGVTEDSMNKIWERPNVKKVWNAGAKILEDYAFYKIQTATEPNLYLNFGGNHILRDPHGYFLAGDGLATRLKQRGWKTVKCHVHNVNTIIKTKKNKPVDITAYFASLPPRGSSL